MRFLIIAFFLNFLLSCNSQDDKKVNHTKLQINPSVVYTEENIQENKKIIDALEKFLITKNNDYSDNNYWVNNDNIYFHYPFFEIYQIENNFNDKNNFYTPTLLSLTRTDDSEINVKLGWFANEGNFSDLKVIYNILAVKIGKEYKFKNSLPRNTKEWKKAKIGDILYKYYPNFNFSKKKAMEFNNFNNRIADFFSTDIIKFKYFISKDVNHFMKIRGYDFETTMFLDNQNGAETFPHDNLIFSGNNSEINKHELVHLYTYWNFKNINPIINEGISTYLGGSKGVKYQVHLKKLKNHIADKNNLDLYDKLFNSNYVLDEETSLMYTIGAFLCDLAYKKGGKKVLFKLMNSGKSDKELMSTLKEIFNLNKDNFNTFIRDKIKNFSDFETKTIANNVTSTFAIQPSLFQHCI